MWIRVSPLYKLIIIVLLGLGLFLFIIQYVYSSILGDTWNEQNDAMQIALNETEMMKVEKAEPFHFEKSYIIVFGENIEKQAMIAWVDLEERQVVHFEYTKDGYNENLLKLKIRETDPEVRILRMTPGQFREEWVWEVWYQKGEKQGDRTYYDYYRFSDGELLTTLTMHTR